MNESWRDEVPASPPQAPVETVTRTVIFHLPLRSRTAGGDVGEEPLSGRGGRRAEGGTGRRALGVPARRDHAVSRHRKSRCGGRLLGMEIAAVAAQDAMAGTRRASRSKSRRGWPQRGTCSPRCPRPWRSRSRGGRRARARRWPASASCARRCATAASSPASGSCAPRSGVRSIRQPRCSTAPTRCGRRCGRSSARATRWRPPSRTRERRSPASRARLRPPATPPRHSRSSAARCRHGSSSGARVVGVDARAHPARGPGAGLAGPCARPLARSSGG